MFVFFHILVKHSIFLFTSFINGSTGLFIVNCDDVGNLFEENSIEKGNKVSDAVRT